MGMGFPWIYHLRFPSSKFPWNSRAVILGRVSLVNAAHFVETGTVILEFTFLWHLQRGLFLDTREPMWIMGSANVDHLKWDMIYDILAAQKPRELRRRREPQQVVPPTPAVLRSDSAACSTRRPREVPKLLLAAKASVDVKDDRRLGASADVTTVLKTVFHRQSQQIVAVQCGMFWWLKIWNFRFFQLRWAWRAWDFPGFIISRSRLQSSLEIQELWFWGVSLSPST